MIKAQIVADSLNTQGDRLISVLATFPRIILAEVNTHRMLSKNTSSSRAIPFKKMVEAVQENPFIPIAWQENHKGMQGDSYLDPDTVAAFNAKKQWLKARDNAVIVATELNDKRMSNVTKQLCNRLLEPFMWTTMLITGSKEGWDNFFDLRCPQYYFDLEEKYFKSKKEWLTYYRKNVIGDENSNFDLQIKDWLYINKGQAEIHIMDLSEKIYDVIQESVPRKLKEGEWHLPMLPDEAINLTIEDQLKWCVGIHANTSYTVVGDGKKLTLETASRIHDKCKEEVHSSVFEHCARAMSDEEYETFIKGRIIDVGCEKETYEDGYECSMQFTNNIQGWCRNYKGFLSYRHIIETNN